jgi:hypothetical protein
MFVRCPACGQVTEPSSWEDVITADGSVDWATARAAGRLCGGEPAISAGDLRVCDGEHACPPPGLRRRPPCPADANQVRCAACGPPGHRPGGARHAPRAPEYEAREDDRDPAGRDACAGGRQRLERMRDGEVVRLAQEACREITAIFRRHGLVPPQVPDPAADSTATVDIRRSPGRAAV